jgi:hypothetical protein
MVAHARVAAGRTVRVNTEDLAMESTLPTPWLMLEGRVPSYGDLASEAYGLARRGTFPDTLADRLEYWRNARRLIKASRWARFDGWRYKRFLVEIGVLRYGFAIFCLPAALLAVDAIKDERTLPLGFLWVLTLFASLSGVIGVAIAASIWSRRKEDVEWAETYRKRRLDVDERLRSPQGYEGWRAVKKPDGSWEFLPVDWVDGRRGSSQ